MRMSLDWIKEAEKSQKAKEEATKEIKLTEQQKANENHIAIKPVLDDFKALIDRVAQLSPEMRKPSMEIGYTHLNGGDQCEFYGSAFITKKKNIALVIGSERLYISWRRLFFKIPEEPGKIKIVVYEKMSSQTKKNDKKKSRTKYKFNIEDLNEKILQKMLEYLVFRTDHNSLKKYLPKNLY
jgi:hypothetical protein